MDPALKLRNDYSYRLGGTGGGGNNVKGGGSCPAQVLVIHIQNPLVVGIGVNGGHQALVDAEALVQYLDHRGNTVGGAGGIGDDLVPDRVVAIFIDTEDDGGVLILGRSGDNHLLSAALQVGRRPDGVGK